MNFLTVFFECSNVELVKDVAQIPNMLNKLYGINTGLVTSYVNYDGQNINCVKNLKLLHFPMIFNGKITGFFFLLRYSKKIKWLNIYHIDKKSYYWIKIYKFLNPNGYVYLKMDLDYRMCEDFEKKQERRIVLQKCSEIADLISAESKCALNRVQPLVNKKILLIPNGYCVSNDLKLNTIKRENIFLTVGRLGTEQKATEVLLQAFADCADKMDWKLRLVGNIEESFQPYIKEYYENHPELKDRVEFVGPINDRVVLDMEYHRAKVFVLPSRWESFGLVLVEAMANGCRLLATDVIPPINELTNDCEFGTIIPADNVLELSKAMVENTKLNYSDNQILKIKEYARCNFSWESICEKLYSEMKECEAF